MTDEELKAALAAQLAARTGGGDLSTGFPADVNSAAAQEAVAARAPKPPPVSDVEANLAAGVDPYAGNLPGHGVSPQIGAPPDQTPAPAPPTNQLSLGQPSLNTGAGGGQAGKLVQDLTLGGTGETQPTKLAAPAPVVIKQPVARTPAQTDGIPPELRPEAIGAHLEGLQERINNVNLAKEQNERGPRDIFAQQVGQVLDKKADFYSHSMEQIRAHQDNLDQLTKQLQGTTGFYQAGDRSRLEQAINSERNIVSDLVHNSNAMDPTSPAARIDKLTNIGDMATAALSGEQRDDLTRAENDKLLTAINSATLTAVQNAKAENDKSLLTHAMTKTEGAKTAQGYAGAALERAQAKEVGLKGDLEQKGLIVKRLLQNAGDKELTPELEQLGKLYAPELHVPAAGGFAETPEGATKAREYSADAAPILDKIKNAITVRSADGVTLPMTAKDAAGKAISGDLQAALMNSEEFKARSPEGWKIVKEQAPEIGSLGRILPALQTLYGIKAKEWNSKMNSFGVKSRIHPMPLLGALHR